VHFPTAVLTTLKSKSRFCLLPLTDVQLPAQIH